MAKPRAVVDSSILITFARSKKLDWLFEAFDSPVLIPPAVHEETVVRGLAKREPDAKLIESAVKRKAIQVKKAKRRLVMPFLHAGESAVLALALENGIQTVCIDEAPARNAAKSIGLRPIGTLGVLALLLKTKRLNRMQVLSVVDDMVRRDFRISAKILEKFRRDTTML